MDLRLRTLRPSLRLPSIRADSLLWVYFHACWWFHSGVSSCEHCRFREFIIIQDPMLCYSNCQSQRRCYKPLWSQSNTDQFVSLHARGSCFFLCDRNPASTFPGCSTFQRRRFVQLQIPLEVDRRGHGKAVACPNLRELLQLVQTEDACDGGELVLPGSIPVLWKKRA